MSKSSPDLFEFHSCSNLPMRQKIQGFLEALIHHKMKNPAVQTQIILFTVLFFFLNGKPGNFNTAFFKGKQTGH